MREADALSVPLSAFSIEMRRTADWCDRPSTPMHNRKSASHDHDGSVLGACNSNFTGTMASPRLTRGIAWFAVVNGLFCLISPLVALAISVPIGLGTVLFDLVSAGVSFTAGLFGLRDRLWAYWLLCVFFALQLGEYEGVVGTFSLVGPIAVRVGFTLSNPPATISLNFFAVLLVVATSMIALQMKAKERLG